MFVNRPNRVILSNQDAVNTGTSIPTSVVGDILLLNRNNQVLTGTPVISGAGNEVIRFYQSLGGSNGILSLDIQVKNIKTARIKGYTAPAEQVTFIGFAGAGTGSINTPINNTQYFLNVLIKDDQRPAAEQKQTRLFDNFVTDATATKGELVGGLVKKAGLNKGFQPYIMFEALSNNVGAAITGTGAITATNGSRTITAGTAIGAVMAVGDWLRIGGTTVTTPVYRIVSIDVATNTAVLNAPFQGTSAVYAVGSNNFITSALFDASLVGIKVSGKPVPFNAFAMYQKVVFDVSMYNDQSTVVSSGELISTPATALYGQGFWQQIRDMEFLAQGYLGVTNRVTFPTAQQIPSTRAAVGALYNTIIIEHDDYHYGQLQGVSATPLSTVLAYSSATAPTPSAKQAAMFTALNSLLTSAGVNIS